jgi:adenosylcobinamide-phosphate synthase
LLKSTFTLRGLTSAGEVTARLLENRDMAGVRTSLRSLVSRDPASLSAEQAAGAAVESVAENTTDSFIAPWLAFALFGLPGAFAYRAINTLDSMIGYRGRYEYLGKASARLDDLVNLIPARVSAGLLLVAGAVLRLDARRGWKVMRRDHARTASPNAGWTMGAMAGLLGVRLEKVDHYVLGAELQQPEASHIRAANRAVAVAATFGALCIMAWLAVRSS